MSFQAITLYYFFYLRLYPYFCVEYLGYSLMKNNKQQLLIQQTDKKLVAFKSLTAIVIPSKGWINTFRTSLKMSLRQLGNH
jgi:hypothetical protein